MSDWDDLQKSLKSGRLGRRAFMQHAAMLGITGTMIGGVLSRAALAASRSGVVT
jgi:hypothetical protein